MNISSPHTQKLPKNFSGPTLLIVFLVLSIILNIFLFFHKGDIVAVLQNSRKEYPHLDPAHELYSKNDLFVNMRPLRERFQDIAQKGNVSIYFEFLNTGANISVNDKPFFPGSLMKIPVAMAVMKNIDIGIWSLDDRLMLTDEDRNPAWGDLYKLPAGTTFTVEDLLVKLLVNSDDTARSMFVRNVGAENIQDVLRYLGLDDVVDQNLQVSPKRYSNFFRSLYAASYLSTKSSEKLLEIMDIPHDIKLLRLSIPHGVNFSHKIGVYGDTNADSGIVYMKGRPYILTVMVHSSSTDEVRSLMQDVSKAAFNYVSQNAN